MRPAAGLFRSAAFRLSLFYLAVFAAFAAALIAYMAWSTRVILASETRETIAAEVRGLAEQYASGGIQQLIGAVSRRTSGPANALYLIKSFSGQTLAGNIAELPPDVYKHDDFVRAPYRHMGDASEAAREAELRVFQLSGGFKLVVGRDIGERVAFERILERAAWVAAGLTLLLGIAGAYYIRARILAPMEAMSGTARAIMGGDLSNRVPIAGRGDEFDRLGESLNAMLARIEALVRGMREVTDNVAHDLKTPLTRLRARAEDALRTIETGRGLKKADQRAVLEETIAEADHLISVFGSLLAIARAEAGEGAGNEIVDLAALARDAAELYEPVAEEGGVAFAVDASHAITVRADPSLLARAISNLIENALTHGGGAVSVSVTADDVLATLSVADTGPGISPQDRERVLERFVRLEESRSRPGSGLGLSLANAIARLHNGSLRLEDNDPGLRAILALPLARDGEHDGGRPDDGTAVTVTE